MSNKRCLRCQKSEEAEKNHPARFRHFLQDGCLARVLQNGRLSCKVLAYRTVILQENRPILTRVVQLLFHTWIIQSDKPISSENFELKISCLSYSEFVFQKTSLFALLFALEPSSYHMGPYSESFLDRFRTRTSGDVFSFLHSHSWC